MSTSKPWIISSPADLAEDERKAKEYKIMYNSKHAFPGVGSSIPEKVQWISSMDSFYDEIRMKSSLKPPNPIFHCKDVLLEKCPDEVRVDFLVNYEVLKVAAEAMLPETQAKVIERVASFIPKFVRERCGNGSSWEDIENCLSFLRGEGFFKEAEVMIAHKKLDKNCNVIEEMRGVLQEIGIDEYASGAKVSSEESAYWDWPLDEVLGKNMYSKDRSDTVYYRLNVEFHYKPGMIEEEKKAADYQMDLEKKRAESALSDNPKTYLLMKRIKNKEANDSEEDETMKEESHFITPDSHQPFWLPKAYIDHHARIQNHFKLGLDESVSIQMRLEKGDTDAGNIQIAMFEKHLEYVKALTSVKERLAAVFALSKVGAYNFHWLIENDDPQKVQMLIKELASIWKNDLLKSDDEILGLGLKKESHSQIADDSPSSSRELLFNFLDSLKETYEACGDDGEIKFDWKPYA